MPLTVLQLNRLRKIDPYLGEAVKALVDGQNALARALGADPAGVVAQPPTIASLSVTASGGIFDIAISDPNTIGAQTRLVNYFVEYATESGFVQPIVLDLGVSRNKRTFLGNQTLYFRAYSSYMGSQPSPPVTFGSPPTAVVGGGAIAGPALQPSQGSGTADGSHPGSGFGRIDRSDATGKKIFVT